MFDFLFPNASQIIIIDILGYPVHQKINNICKKKIEKLQCLDHRVSVEWKNAYMKKLQGAWELFLVL